MRTPNTICHCVVTLRTHSLHDWWVHEAWMWMSEDTLKTKVSLPGKYRIQRLQAQMNGFIIYQKHQWSERVEGGGSTGCKHSDQSAVSWWRPPSLFGLITSLCWDVHSGVIIVICRWIKTKLVCVGTMTLRPDVLSLKWKEICELTPAGWRILEGLKASHLMTGWTISEKALKKRPCVWKEKKPQWISMICTLIQNEIQQLAHDLTMTKKNAGLNTVPVRMFPIYVIMYMLHNQLTTT